MLAGYGYLVEKWLVQIEMREEYEIHTEFQRLSTKIECKFILRIFVLVTCWNNILDI